MRHLALLALLLSLTACGEDGEVSSPAATDEPSEEVAVPDDQGADPDVDDPVAPLEDPAGDGIDADASAAVAAYRASIAAFERGDASAYGAAYAETLRCFFGREGRTRDEVVGARRAPLERNAASPGLVRLRSIELRRIRSTEDEVELADFGWTGTSGLIDIHFHRKRVVLARQDGTWRIVTENPLPAGTCGFTPYDESPPLLWRQLRGSLASMIETCEGPPGSTMEDGYPGIGGSNGCDPYLNFGGAEYDCEERLPQGVARTACERRARAEIDAIVGEE